MQNIKNNKPNLLLVLSVSVFRKLWLAQVISQIALNMLIFVLGVLVYESTKSNLQVSLLYLVVGLPAAIFGILSGVYVDKFNKRSVLIVSTLIRVLLLIILIIAKSNMIAVYFIMALISIASQFFVPAEASLIPRVVNKELLLSANSLYTLTFYVAIISGFVLGGPFLAMMGDTTILFFITGLFLLSTFFCFLIPKKLDDDYKSAISVSQLKNDIIMTIKFIKNVPKIQQAILLMAMAQAVISIFLTLGPGFADKILLIKVTDASLIILGPAAIGMIVGAVLVGSFGVHFRKKKLIHFGILLSGIILMLLAIIVRTRRYSSIPEIFIEIFAITFDSGVFTLSMICFFLLGFANSFIDISCNTVLQENTTNENRGKIYGVLASLISGVALFPVIISGFLADFLGIGKIIFVLGIIITGIGIFSNKVTQKFNNS